MAQRNKPELLAPAGDLERLRAALDYGADAVYLGRESFSMRAAASNFHSAEQLHEAVALAHQYGKKVYLTCNTLPRNEEIPTFPRFLQEAQDAGADALILADLGLLAMARKLAPDMEIHMSTQTGIVNYSTCRALYDMGVKRAVLARELSLEEIAGIRAKIPAEMELEVFVHGAMCMSFSGRCLLSAYLTGRDANRGACAQPCRWNYQLVESKRPGQYFPIEETDEGTYIFNAKDLCMVEHLQELLDAGVDSLKIEGRAKSAYYAAVVTGAYRHCLDDAAAGRPIDPVWRDEVEHVSHRPYSTGFYYGYPGQYYENSRYIREWQVVALVTECDAAGNAVISLRNKFRTGDTVELVGPDLRPFSVTVPEMRDESGTVVEEPRNPQMLLKLKLPCHVPPMTLVRHQVELSAK